MLIDTSAATNAFVEAELVDDAICALVRATFGDGALVLATRDEEPDGSCPTLTLDMIDPRRAVAARAMIDMLIRAVGASSEILFVEQYDRRVVLSMA